MPLGILTLLICAWTMSAESLLWTLFVLVVFLFPPITLFLTITLANPRFIKLSFKELYNDVLKVLINISLLPHQAYLSLDSVSRVFYRRLISHRHLLEWHTGNSSSEDEHKRFMKNLGIVPLFSVVLLGFVFSFHPGALFIALPFCILWFFTPVIVYFLDRPAQEDKPIQKISDDERLYIREMARKTWRYFDDFVGPQSNWLPPDNYQQR